jgi:hypothetical protein
MLRSRHRPHLLATGALVVLSGAVTGLAAAGNIGPFTSLGTTSHRTVAAQWPRTPLRADSLFPAPTPLPPVHEAIVVRDPALRHVATTPRNPSLHSPPPTAEPTSTPMPTPTPSSCGDDCGGGGGD